MRPRIKPSWHRVDDDDEIVRCRLTHPPPIYCRRGDREARVPAFEDDVSAYPAITILRNGEQRAAHVVEAAKELDATCAAVTHWAKGKGRRRLTSTAFDACKVDTWFSGRDLWPSGSPSQTALLADLEHRFSPLEDARTGTRVGIGVATGCDEVYITRDSTFVEVDRLLPLRHHLTPTKNDAPDSAPHPQDAASPARQ